MSSREQDKGERDARSKMVEDIEEKQVRKMHARRTEHLGTWFGLGMMGTIGWTVTIPTLLGVILGIWIDARWPSSISWTLVLLIGGLLLGCVNAWLWIAHQQRAMEKEEEDSDVE
jgi:ATP synthase protein I